MSSTQEAPKVSNKFYDALKFLALVILPATGAMYFSLSQIWGLPRATEVVGTITVVDTFLGVVLRLSSTAYKNNDAQYDGVLNVSAQPNGKLLYDLGLNGDVAALAGQKSVSFKVEKKVDSGPLE